MRVTWKTKLDCVLLELEFCIETNRIPANCEQVNLSTKYPGM